MGSGKRAFDNAAKVELNRHARLSSILTGFGALLLVVFMIAVTAIEGRADELERTGTKVSGEVTEVRERLGGIRQPSIVVAFIWQSQNRSERVTLNDSSPKYTSGQIVDVFVDPNNAERLVLSGEDNQSPLSVWLMISALLIGSGAVAAGAASLLRARQQRRILTSSDWQRLGLMTRTKGNTRRPILGRQGARATVVLRKRPEDSWRSYVLLATGQSRLLHSGLDRATELDVAGDLEGRSVLRVPETGALFSARANVPRFWERWRSD